MRRGGRNSGALHPRSGRSASWRAGAGEREAEPASRERTRSTRRRSEMIGIRQMGLLALLLAALTVYRSPVRAEAPAGNTPQPGPAASAPVIDPQAERLLRETGDYLKAAQQLSFHAEITYDDLLPTGQKIELAAEYDAAVRRPDRVYTEYWGDAGGRRFWYDGKTITLYDPTLGVYGSEPAKPTIDATLEQLITVLG